MFGLRGIVQKTLILIIAAIIILGGVAIALYLQPTSQQYKIKIFTGGTAGVYYPIGNALAEILNKYSNGKIQAVAQSSGASVANAKALSTGDAQLVFIQNDVAYYAYKGIYMFTNASINNIRGVAVLYPEIIQIVVKADSGIKNLMDLTNKRVAIGAAGSGTAVEGELILKAAGLWGKVTIQNLDFAQASEALKLGQIDAAFIVAGIPTAAVTQLAATTPVNLINIPNNIFDALKSQGYLFFVPVTVPKDTYNGMTADVTTAAVMAMLAVRSDLPDDAVYTILNIMFSHLTELQQAHARASSISLNTALNGMSIPLHPGAVKFYQDKGITIPSELKP
ncbi:MAG: TAXI family TRAP transporter solute-binding subunit [Thermoprotei archaeon]